MVGAALTISRGDWSLEFPPHILADKIHVEVMAMHSKPFISALNQATLDPALLPCVASSMVETLPHGLQFPNEPARLHLRAKLGQPRGEFRVLLQPKPGAPWRLSDEVVELSADGQRASIAIHSFSNRVLVDIPEGVPYCMEPEPERGLEPEQPSEAYGCVSR
jgi:hypothetical protein